MGCKVIIIGAGWSGLATAKTYLQIDPSIELVILESEETLGGTWCASRIFPELLTQQATDQYVYPDTPYEPSNEPPQPGNYIPSRRVHEYLNKYAEQWGIKDKIRFGVTVERCKRAPDGVKWEVYLKGKDGEGPLVCDKLIVASGITSLPNLPDIPEDNFTPLTFHSRYLGQHYSVLQSQEVNTVCVYGAGKSGYDAVTAAINHGKRVHWIIRDKGGMPPFFKPVLLGRPTDDTTFTPANNALLPDITDTTSWVYRFFHSGKNRFGSWLMWWYVGFMTHMVLRGWKYDQNENLKKLKPDVYERSIFWCTQTPYSVPDDKIIDLVREGKVITVHKAEITKLSGKQVHLSTGTVLETDMLVQATGWRTDIPFFSEEESLALGLPVQVNRLSSLDSKLQYPSEASQKATNIVLETFPRLANPPGVRREAIYTQHRLYRFMVPLPLVEANDRSLVFVGRLTGIGLSIINDVLALWAVAWLTNEMKVDKKKEEIEWEVDLYNAYMRSRYLDAGRHPQILTYEWAGIIHIMMKELGVPLPQKSVWRPWLPADYGGMVDKWKAAHPKRANET
ncbi:FAD/NAD(P)-binding domain-containing protein [Serendipita vermifera]|nr:FAD/NAD(P)-binding domain-containing protein [Serendipita vermifera]